MRHSKLIAALAVASLAAPAAADAHVTLQPEEAAAGGFTRFDVRVPNERDDAGTEEVRVQMPPGFIFVSYEPVDGWSVDVKKSKLDKPIDSHGEKITEQVSEVVFKADSSRDVIGPGEFRDFGLSVGVPEGKPDSKLTFKSIQTYEGGEVVRWIETTPEAEHPAPQVTLTAAEGEHGAAAEAEADTASAQPASASSDDGGDDGGSDTLAIIALIVGALALGASAFAILRRPGAAT